MHTILIVLSSVLTLVSAGPYLLDTLKGKTKPRVATWFIWAVLTGIASAASFADHQYASAILTFSAMIEDLAIVVLGIIKSGDLSLEKLDFYCLIGAGTGLVLWWLFNSPSIAIVASLMIDFIGAVPTIKHTWQKPYEETWLKFVLSAVGGAFAVLASQSFSITALAYPVYIAVTDGSFAAIILLRHKYARSGEPAELREL